jgi:hypothetical protein
MFHVFGGTHMIMSPATANDQYWPCVGVLHSSHFPVWCSTCTIFLFNLRRPRLRDIWTDRFDGISLKALYCTMRWDLGGPSVRHPTYAVCVYAAHWLFCSTLRPDHLFFVSFASFGPTFFALVIFLSK